MLRYKSEKAQSVYKTALHQAVWFPYRPEQRFMGPLLVVLLLAIGSTGTVKTIDIFTSFISSGSAGHEAYLTVLLFFLCLAMSINAARCDYFSACSAILPCMNTVFIIAVLTFFFIFPVSHAKTAFVQAGISTFATLALIGRFVQSGGADLGKLGTLCRRAKGRVQKMSKEAIDSPDFAEHRVDLVADIEALAKAIKETEPEVVCGSLCHETVDKLDEFISRSKWRDALSHTLQALN
jgi:hypothetical protein